MAVTPNSAPAIPTAETTDIRISSQAAQPAPFRAASHASAAPIDAFPQNVSPHGIRNMTGNVAEWTLDQYQADAYAAISDQAIDPWRQPTALHPRTVRGGSYQDDAEELRSSNRIESDLQWKKRDPQIPKSFWWNTDSPFVGFRIVRPMKEPSKEEQKAFWDMVLGG